MKEYNKVLIEKLLKLKVIIFKCYIYLNINYYHLIIIIKS